MEKAIEIKRRAQRCIQNNDLDGALSEYEKLVQSEEADPYNFVLLADLLFKKGDPGQAAERYLSAVESYEKASLYKNAIAVCKKMLRLSLSQARVLKSLANLHALDGFAGESALYYVQYAEQMVRSNLPEEASQALRAAFDVCQDNVRVLEQLSESYLLCGDQNKAAAALLEAARHYRSRNQEVDAARCAERATQLDANAVASEPVKSVALNFEPARATNEPAPDAAIGYEPGVVSMASQPVLPELASNEPATGETPPLSAPESDRVEGLESGRVLFGVPQPEIRLETYDSKTMPAPVLPPAPPSLSELESVEIVDEEPASTVYEISDEEPTEVSTGVYEITADKEPTEASTGVYEIMADEEPDASVYEIAEEAEAMVAGGGFDELDATSTSAPGLAFAADLEPEFEPTATAAAAETNVDQVEHLLVKAQEQFRAGDREMASQTLASAAQAYEQLGRLDNAATIYRSLGRGAQSTLEVMTLWLGNCQARGDAPEAAQVACELGDRALNDGDESTAREWFQQATAFDAENEVAKRRLQRLADGASSPADSSVAIDTEAPNAAAAPGAPAVAEGGEMGRVEVAVGRGEAVTFDLSGLLAEFQRGVEAQLSGDAQSHYDLGMTYREMGLVDQAVDSFRIAEQEPRLSARALEMTGRCFTDQQRFAEAVVEFERALGQPNLDPMGAAELRYQLALALESAGDPASALREYEAVAEVLSGYEDVDARIASLRGATGAA